jgi:Flp pilus assembly secretin CpaC
MQYQPLRRLSAALAAATMIAAAAGPALAAGLEVHVDQSVRVALAGSASSVVVGNPSIADVSVVDDRTLLVLGKGYGVTNLVVLDHGGHVLYDRDVVVSSADDGRVSIWRGPTPTAYACSPRCERAPMPAATPAAGNGP